MRSCESSFSRLMLISFRGERKSISTFLLSLRNHVYNEIMAAIELNDARAIRERIKDRQIFRRKWKAQYRAIRKGGA